MESCHGNYLALPPEFTQISFTPCQTYIPWYFIVDGDDTTTYLADFSEEGLSPSQYNGYLMYLNHRRSTVPFDIDHFLMAVDLQGERVNRIFAFFHVQQLLLLG